MLFHKEEGWVLPNTNLSPIHKQMFDDGILVDVSEDWETLKKLNEQGGPLVWDESQKGVVALPLLGELTDVRSAFVRNERATKLSNVYSPATEQLSRWLNCAEGDLAAQIYYKSQRTAWHAWADALCDLPDQPGWPWPEGDVPWPEQPPKPTRYTAP